MDPPNVADAKLNKRGIRQIPDAQCYVYAFFDQVQIAVFQQEPNPSVRISPCPSGDPFQRRMRVEQEGLVIATKIPNLNTLKNNPSLPHSQSASPTHRRGRRRTEWYDVQTPPQSDDSWRHFAPVHCCGRSTCYRSVYRRFNVTFSPIVTNQISFLCRSDVPLNCL